MRLRKQCETQLLKRSSKIPKRVYCYRPISEYLKTFVKRDLFLTLCNKWRQRTGREGYYADVYDGHLWRTEANGYLANIRHLYGMMNIDWFQPYKHTPYSLGAIYFVILNLPRSVRFHGDNVMLVGLIPGPTEPPLHVNTYLRPIIEDLQQLDIGIHMNDATRYGNNYRFRLLGCSSDLPATRKLGGFLSFHAKYGKNYNNLPWSCLTVTMLGTMYS